MKKLVATALSLSTIALTSAPAFADTYAVVINSLNEPINLGGAKIMPGESAWTPLNASIVMPNGKFASIQDNSIKTKNGGWLIQSLATLPSVTEVKLGFAEVGCIAAVVNDKGQGKTPIPLYSIDMTQMSGTRCSDNWWQKTGKSDVSLVVNWIQTAQKNAIDALSLLAK